MLRVGILGSGRGTNARAILEAEAIGELGPAEVAGILSDRAEAPILALSQRFQKPARFIAPGRFRTKLEPEAEQAFALQLQEWSVDLVVLAGFMRVVKAPLLDAFGGRILNLHPSLLPSFPGLNAIGQAFDYGVRFTGCTVHWVSAQVDAGRIIDQAVVRIEPTDTLESLEEKVHEAEHRLLPQVIARLAIAET
ncbi:MAG: phosphoribosylglycinamide formyltransferase [Opitutales bacterium]